jgi:stage III sporulation protein AE
MYLLTPLLTSLILTTGCITISNLIQPILIFLSTMIGTFINNFLIPILLTSITISVVSNISSKAQLDKLSKFLKSSVVWILGIVLTIFTCLISVEGTLGSSVDGLTSKTTKAAVSNFIPVIGKILGDTSETVIGCCNVLKNAVGIIGLIVILGIVIVPIIKILTLWVTFCITSAICEIVADERIVRLTNQIADSYKILLAILFSASVIFFISITLVLKITNSVVT